jgi:VWFA-related protein
VIRRLLAVAVLTISAGIFAAAQDPAPVQTPQPVFRSNTDVVTVPVFVKGSAGAAAGLTAADFVLTDNGVPQQVEVIDSETVPVDVTVLLETSAAFKDYAASINEQVGRIASLIRPGDRLEILGIDDYVTVLLPLGPATRAAKINRFSGGGLTSVNDAMVAALLRDPDPDHRHLIITLTDSIDTMSTLGVPAVRDVARQSNATLVVAWITLSEDPFFVPPPTDPTMPPPWITSSERLERHVRTEGSQRVAPVRQVWTPHLEPPPGRTIYAFNTLREAVESTGGSLHPPGFFTERNAAAIFDKIYAEFRRTYVLRFLPRDVSRLGWHDLTVTIPRSPSLEVRARRGYLVEATAVRAPAAVSPSAPPPGSFAALMSATSGDDAAALRATISAVPDVDALAALIKEFRAGGNVSPANPRREFATTLALAGTAAASSSADLRRDAVDLVTRAAPLVRAPTGPDDFEREWLDAAVAILAGAMRPTETFPLVRGVVARFPDDPALLLARAVIADQLGVLPGPAVGRELGAPAQQQLIAYYDAAIGQDETTVEARIRKAWLLRRLGREDDARAQLDLLGASVAAPFDEWRKAVATTSVLMAPPVDDPLWREFWQGSFRALPALLDRVLRHARTSN